jgi:hypothetical protein
MKEDPIETLRQQDTNLRDAIRLEEEALPPMPADLNARLMQRVEEERAKEVAKRRRARVLWPLVAAACVAALIAVFLTPPKGTLEDGLSTGKPVAVNGNKPKKEKEAPQVEAPQKTTQTEAPQEEMAEQPKVNRPAATTSQPLLAQKPVAEKADAEEVVAVVASSTERSIPETPHNETATVVLTERDIPITRPENYQYTPEEIALMKKQANEAYLKWVELELEISKYTLEKMAQK